ncbi:hypothetical protein CA13_05090 [Planctomycetes bacterium CA13]|uniref:Uncharacterized protein n=2 Tax=Novipirellula herctigrandis TaxID=2527986 RepID=A0A5C5YVN1_9BACT|nr:hypothetical protein CA13_05090 [Planctomycetes bacterium CA13]
MVFAVLVVVTFAISTGCEKISFEIPTPDEPTCGATPCVQEAEPEMVEIPVDLTPVRLAPGIQDKRQSGRSGSQVIPGMAAPNPPSMHTNPYMDAPANPKDSMERPSETPANS